MATTNDGKSHISSQFFRRWWRVPQPWRYLIVVAIYLILWGTLDKVALLFETIPEISIWYPPSALDFVLLLVFGLHYSPALLLNTLIHDYLVTGRHLGFVTLLIFTLVTTLGYAGACALLLLKLQINPRLRSLRDVVWFVVVAALAAPFVVALLQVINFAWAGIVPCSNWLIYTLHYWAGDATGIAMLAPFILILLRQVPGIWYYREGDSPEQELRLRLPTIREIPELLVEIVVLALAIWAAYGAPRGFRLDYTYFVFLPAIWSAMRHGLPRAAATVLSLNIGVAFLVRARVGPSGVLALQFCMMAVSQIGLLLGGVASQRQHTAQALRHSAQHLKILYELDQAILAVRSLWEIAQVALHWTKQLIPYQGASIVIFDFEAQECRVVATQMNGTTHVEPGLRLPLEAFGNISALQQGEVNVGQNIRMHSELPAAAPVLFGEGVRAYLNVPIIVQGELVGSLNLGKNSLGTFKSSMVKVACDVANQVALAIQQERLFNQVEQQAARERSLNQICRVLNSSLNPNQILQEFVQLTGECLRVDQVLLFTIEAEEIGVLNEWRASNSVVSILNLRIPLSEWPEIQNPNSDFYRHRVFHAPDYTQVSSTSTQRMQVEQAHTLSVLSVPIFIRDQLFGGLSLHTTTMYRTFTEDEIQLIQRIADQAAIALYNAQSYERLEELVKQRTQELEEEKFISEAANRAKSEFLSNMSHELRTPLSGILGFSKVLLEQIFGPLNAKQQQYIERINTSGKHLLELINDLLDLSKIEAGKEELTLETVVVEEVATACISLVQERANNKGLQLLLEVAPDVTTCVADQRRLKQILVNLLSNAVKFTDSGSVTLKVEQTQKEMTFSVIDTGIGITQEDLATLFQPFDQLDSGLNRKYEGTGLGLALSRKLALLHDGEITVHSELGYGSCFTLHLPKRGEG